MKLKLVYSSLVLCLFLFTDLVNSYVLPVEGDCVKYQVCDYSGCFVFNCGIGTEFNPKIGVCDYPLQDRTSCGGRIGLGLGLTGGSIPSGQGPVGPGGPGGNSCPGGSECQPGSQGPIGNYPGGQGPIGGGYPGEQGPIGGYSGGQGPTGGYSGGQGPTGGYSGNRGPTGSYSGGRGSTGGYSGGRGPINAIPGGSGC